MSRTLKPSATSRSKATRLQDSPVLVTLTVLGTKTTREMAVGNPDSDRVIILMAGTSSRGFRAAAFLMVMSLAVMVAAGVTVNDGAIEEHRQHLLHGKLWSACVDADA